MAFAEEEARRQGAGEMRLYTNEAFSENLAFYKRLGYRETEYEPFEGTELVHLAKRLCPAIRNKPACPRFPMDIG